MSSFSVCGFRSQHFRQVTNVSPGSSGAVGGAATQLLQFAGAVSIETSRKAARGLVNITEDLVPQIEQVTGGAGIVAVLDTVGEAGLFKKVLEALAPNGR